MKYFIFFTLVFVVGCFGSDDNFEEEGAEPSDEEVGSQPIGDANPPYRMGCGESMLKTDALGNQYFIPILCQDFFIDKGRPADRTFINNEIVNDVSQPMTIVAQPFSDYDS